MGVEKLPDKLFRIPTTMKELFTARICLGDIEKSSHICESASVEATRDIFEDQPNETHSPRNPKEFWSLGRIGITDKATSSDDDKQFRRRNL